MSADKVFHFDCIPHVQIFFIHNLLYNTAKTFAVVFMYVLYWGLCTSGVSLYCSGMLQIIILLILQ